MSIPHFNQSKCTLCGKCIAVCPKRILEQHERTIRVTVPGDCMLCAHCYDVCAPGAVSFDPSCLRNVSFSSFPYKEKMAGPKTLSPEAMVNAFRSRRSVRRYQERPVPEPVIRDLVEFGITAPSGSNRQVWEFTVLNGRPRVWELAGEIGRFFRKINALARNPVTRYLSVISHGDALIRYHRERIATVEWALAEAEKGNDLLFHGAPAVVIAHSVVGGSTPVEDAQYATYNMALLAPLLGLGTCYIGYAVEAINRASAIKEWLGIPPGNRVHAVLTLGYPAVTFARPSLRKPYRLDLR